MPGGFCEVFFFDSKMCHSLFQGSCLLVYVRVLIRCFELVCDLGSSLEELVAPVDSACLISKSKGVDQVGGQNPMNTQLKPLKLTTNGVFYILHKLPASSTTRFSSTLTSGSLAAGFAGSERPRLPLLSFLVKWVRARAVPGKTLQNQLSPSTPRLRKLLRTKENIIITTFKSDHSIYLESQNSNLISSLYLPETGYRSKSWYEYPSEHLTGFDSRTLSFPNGGPFATGFPGKLLGL